MYNAEANCIIWDESSITQYDYSNSNPIAQFQADKQFMEI